MQAQSFSYARKLLPDYTVSLPRRLVLFIVRSAEASIATCLCSIGADLPDPIWMLDHTCAVMGRVLSRWKPVEY
jgi:hypothetical protein